MGRFAALQSRAPVARLFSYLIVPLVWLGSSQAQQPPNTGTIVGELRVARANFPPTRVLMTLERSGAQAGSVYTDGEGRFSFEDVPGNLYHIVAHQEGFRPVDVAVALNPSVQHVLYVHIELIPEETASDIHSKPEGLAGGNPAMVHLSALLSNFPRHARKQYERAARLQKQGKRQEAIEYYERALRIAPDMYFARNNLGSLYLENMKFGEAETEFRKVIADNQADANAYFNLANVCLLTKRYGESLEFARQGLTRQPNSALGNFIMGSVLLQKGDGRKAEQYLRSALDENPALANAHLALVNLYIQESRNGDAIKELSTFLEQSPDSDFARQARELLKKLQSQRKSLP